MSDKITVHYISFVSGKIYCGLNFGFFSRLVATYCWAKVNCVKCKARHRKLLKEIKGGAE